MFHTFIKLLECLIFAYFFLAGFLGKSYQFCNWITKKLVASNER